MAFGRHFGRKRPNHQAVRGPAAPGGGSSNITFAPIVSRSGSTYTFTAIRDSTVGAEDRTINVAGSTLYDPAAVAADFGGSFPSAVAHFLDGEATATFNITGNSAVQPE